MEQITSRLYYEMEGTLPPQARHAKDNGQGMIQGFLVGEPSDHNKEGVALYKPYFAVSDEFYTREPMTQQEFISYIDNFNISEELACVEYAEECDEYLTLLQDYPEEAIQAYIACFGSNQADYLEGFEEAYQGQWDSDEEFAQQMAEDTGFEHPEHWPYSCIDWEHAARELMYDYAEDNGYYFRNI